MKQSRFWAQTMSASVSSYTHSISQSMAVLTLQVVLNTFPRADLGEMRNLQKPSSARLGQILITLCKCSHAILINIPSCCLWAGTIYPRHLACIPQEPPKHIRALDSLQILITHQLPLVFSLTCHYTTTIHSSLSDDKAPRYFNSLIYA